jgi:hypothetical protein
MSELDFTQDQKFDDRGVPPGGDDAIISSAVLVDKDPARNRVQVSVRGGDPQWMLAARGRYIRMQTVLVLRNPITQRYEYCLGPTQGYETWPTTTLTSASSTRGVVTWDGVSYSLPFMVAGVYAAGQRVYLGLDDATLGTPAGIFGVAPDPLPALAQPYPQTVPSRAQSVTGVTYVTPEWSGTWRVDSAAWNQWQIGAYGLGTLWQGNDGYGSGVLTGLATYGSRITDLNATTITDIQVTVRGADIAATSYPDITLQGSVQGEMPVGAPTLTGDTVVASPGRSGIVLATLTANMRAAMKSGAVRGLGLVGSGYAAIRGADSADGMTLKITYTKPS